MVDSHQKVFNYRQIFSFVIVITLVACIWTLMFFSDMLIVCHPGSLSTILYHQHYDNDLILVIKHRKRLYFYKFLCSFIFASKRFPEKKFGLKTNVRKEKDSVLVSHETAIDTRVLIFV